MRYAIIALLGFLLSACAVKHYQEAFNMRKDSFTGEQVATMVREYPTVEKIRNPMNTRPYRINIHWSKKGSATSPIKASLTIVEYQEAVPDLTDTLYIRADGKIRALPMTEARSELLIAGTDSSVSLKKVHFASFEIPASQQTELAQAQNIVFRFYAGQATYTAPLNINEMKQLKQMIRF
jgi:PBP1b-binding outer membrane lipoprotein LpoB